MVRRAAPRRTTTVKIYIWKEFGWIWGMEGVVWFREKAIKSFMLLLLLESLHDWQNKFFSLSFISMFSFKILSFSARRAMLAGLNFCS